ncbi:hypothetical protein WG954_07415 [Lacibacter sp. H375]|uniref:hypothetical protein n=1 Tax=Lacibacter sp. H375 TaxID=3133424 RepID=UPI0030BA8748
MYPLFIKILRSLYFRLIADYTKEVGEKQFPAGVVADMPTGNNLLSSLIQNGKPFMVSRFGVVELATVYNYLELQKYRMGGLHGLVADIKGYKKVWSADIKNIARNQAGVFPETDAACEEFARVFIKGISNIDVLGVWYFIPKEYKTIRQYSPEAKLVEALSLEPFRFQTPWSSLLKGKRILVIHPFSDTILKQYKQRERLFLDKTVLPDFELKVLKAPQTAAKSTGGYKSWFDAYEHMCREIEKQDFDLAIIGAGAYGLPLASHVKSMGKQAIHMGGATQLLFGIKGKRWDENGFGDEFYNEAWVRPSESERPNEAELVEGACYW